MTAPEPSCDRPASIGTNDDGTWNVRCGCDEFVLESGTYAEVCAALEQHRAAVPPVPDES
jgi:hypothetical protein